MKAFVGIVAIAILVAATWIITADVRAELRARVDAKYEAAGIR